MAEPSRAEFVKICRTGIERLWMHRTALRRVSVRIGYWPDGMVIHANIPSRTPAELASILPPQVIPWDQVATLTEDALLQIVDDICLPLYGVLGMAVPAEVAK